MQLKAIMQQQIVGVQKRKLLSVIDLVDSSEWLIQAFEKMQLIQIN